MRNPKPVRTKVTNGKPTVHHINVGKNHPMQQHHGSPSGRADLCD